MAVRPFVFSSLPAVSHTYISMPFPSPSSEKAPIFYSIRLASYAVMSLNALGHSIQPIAVVVPLEAAPGDGMLRCKRYLQNLSFNFQAGVLRLSVSKANRQNEMSPAFAQEMVGSLQ